MPGVVQRFAPRILLCGGLGVLTTVAVAWGLAACLPHRGLQRHRNLISQAPVVPASEKKKPVPVYVSVVEFSRTGMVRRSWNPGLSNSSELLIDLTPESQLAMKQTINQDRTWGRLPRLLAGDFARAGSGVEDARGWPMLAMWCEMDELASGGIAVRGGIRANAMKTTGSARVLPLWPIWRGFAVDSMVFAGAWGVMIAAGLRCRRVIRRRRGRCAACGYDRCGASGPCPECGVA